MDTEPTPAWKEDCPSRLLKGQQPEKTSRPTVGRNIAGGCIRLRSPHELRIRHPHDPSDGSRVRTVLWGTDSAAWAYSDCTAFTPQLSAKTKPNPQHPAPASLKPPLRASSSPKPPPNIPRSTKDARILRKPGTTVPHQRSADDTPYRSIHHAHCIGLAEGCFFIASQSRPGANLKNRESQPGPE